MTETIEVTITNGRLRADPWFHDHDLGGVLGGETHRHDVMVHPVEVGIIATLAATNGKTIRLGWLARTFDADRGDWITKPHERTGLAVGYVDTTALAVVDPAASASYAIGTDTIFDIWIET